MPLRFAINGLGRIGRALLRQTAGREDIVPVAVNDPAAVHVMAHLLRHDTVHRAAGLDAAVDGSDLRVGSQRIAVFGEVDRTVVPWDELDATVVVEATGGATARAVAAEHLRPPVDTVLVSAIADDADLTLVPGVGAGPYDRERHRVVSASSCTTHCLALVVRVLHEAFGVRQAMMNEVHSYTADQRLLDAAHPDLRRARAAASNVVPTSTAAPDVVAALVPGLHGRLGGRAIRVPIPDVALLDLVAVLERPATTEEVRDRFRGVAGDPLLRDVLGVVDEPLVSSDFVGDTRSAVVDLPLVECRGELCRVMAWYDNEWGFAARLVDFLAWMDSSG